MFEAVYCGITRKIKDSGLIYGSMIELPDIPKLIRFTNIKLNMKSIKKGAC